MSDCDGIHAFWFKKFPSTHNDSIKTKMNMVPKDYERTKVKCSSNFWPICRILEAKLVRATGVFNFPEIKKNMSYALFLIWKNYLLQ